ncbi:hypothetical protein [Streptomyces olivaceus]|uniref:hypothetical protein n=1 Tax=Streptomyces olivaceus TaxID=47716 RepID=UPI0022EE2EFD|nr:hypothetical protein [Streptomyces olivaceus]GHI91708.1 hypothetical protein TPA0905_11790 [Streptomyces olivaceus]
MAEPTTEHLRLPELTDEQREQLLQRVAETGAMLLRIAEAIAPSVQAAARELARAVQTLQKAGYLTEDGKPVKRPDRPDWASPYGPPLRRR